MKFNELGLPRLVAGFLAQLVKAPRHPIMNKLETRAAIGIGSEAALTAGKVNNLLASPSVIDGCAIEDDTSDEVRAGIPMGLNTALQAARLYAAIGFEKKIIFIGWYGGECPVTQFIVRQPCWTLQNGNTTAARGCAYPLGNGCRRCAV
jgi:hypothetical protein